MISRVNQISEGKPKSYSIAVEIASSSLIFVSGQVGVDADDHAIAADVGAQFAEILRRFDVILEDLGLDRSAFVKVTILTTDRNAFYAAGPESPVVAFGHYFQSDPPVATLLVVESLSQPDLKVEVEAVLARVPVAQHVEASR